MEAQLDEPAQESFRKRLTVPSGFRNLLEGLTVEILRSNPSDIYTFAAEYFKSRLQERQGERVFRVQPGSIFYRIEARIIKR